MLIYTIGVLASGSFWLLAFLTDGETPKSHVASWVVLCVASLIWPISVPLSCAELLNQAKHQSFREQRLMNQR